MWITGRATPEQAFDDIYTVNDGQPEPSRKAILRMFDEGLARV